MKKIIDFFKKILTKKPDKLLQNNSGDSIKSWFLYGTFLCGASILLATIFVLVWDVVTDGKVDSNINDISQIILAVSALFTAAGLPKIVGEIFENRKTEDKNEKNRT